MLILIIVWCLRRVTNVGTVTYWNEYYVIIIIEILSLDKTVLLMNFV